MGKTLIQQARGKGGPRYTSPSFRFKGKIQYRATDNSLLTGIIKNLIDCPGHHAPLMKVVYADGKESMLVAPEGLRIGATIEHNTTTIQRGNIMTLKTIPAGVPIFSIESRPGDGGKLCRTSGLSAKIIAKSEKGVTVLLPSKKKKVFHPTCRATIGMIAGSGRPEKPFLKAGRKFHQMKAKNKLYPRSSASAMNAVDHPYGNKRSSRKAHQKATGRFAPPGRKVGKISPKRTGKKK